MMDATKAMNAIKAYYRDHSKEIRVVLQSTQPIRQDNFEFGKKGVMENRI